MSKIIVIGSSNTDMVIKSDRLPGPGETILGGTFLMNPGGKGANQAVAAARLDAEVVFIARVGADIFGIQAIRGFERAGIDTDFVVVDPDEPSGVALIMVNASGENCISVASGSNMKLTPSDVDKAIGQIDAAAVLLMQLESPLRTVEHAAMLGRQRNKVVILNPAPAQPLPDSLLANLDIITPNESEAELLTGIKVDSPESAHAAAEALRSRGVGTVIITMGAQGACVLSGSFSGLVPTHKVKAVDTTAAGDTFNGALAVGLVNGMPVQEAVAFANKAAAVSVTRFGAQASCPTQKDLQSLENLQP